jgi:very-short-patch-repair endonuclease
MKELREAEFLKSIAAGTGLPKFEEDQFRKMYGFYYNPEEVPKKEERLLSSFEKNMLHHFAQYYKLKFLRMAEKCDPEAHQEMKVGMFLMFFIDQQPHPSQYKLQTQKSLVYNRYTADFLVTKNETNGVVVEVDGSQHEICSVRKEKDRVRDLTIAKHHGYPTIRIRNHDIQWKAVKPFIQDVFDLLDRRFIILT